MQIRRGRPTRREHRRTRRLRNFSGAIKLHNLPHARIGANGPLFMLMSPGGLPPPSEAGSRFGVALEVAATEVGAVLASGDPSGAEDSFAEGSECYFVHELLSVTAV